MPASSAVRPIRIRPFRTVDGRTVRRLWNGAGLRLGPTDTAAGLARARRRDPDLFLVATSDRQIVGAVLGRFDGSRGWVNHLAVLPGRQRQGIGRALLLELERRLRRKGCWKINLHVEPANGRVIGFYERFGWTRREMVFMEKWVAGPKAARVSQRSEGTDGLPRRRR